MKLYERSSGEMPFASRRSYWTAPSQLGFFKFLAGLWKYFADPSEEIDRGT